MIPITPMITDDIEEITHPNRTYRISFKEISDTQHSQYGTRIDGTVDDLEAVRQAVYVILGTERYKFPIYSWDYGVELVDLIGKPMPYIMAELPERIKEALLVDNRISDVTDFEFSPNGKKLGVSFTVISNAGSILNEMEVEV